MTGTARDLSIVLLMAREATVHRRHAGSFRHDFHLGHLTVAHFALHAGLHMNAMRPVHTWKDSIDAHPGNGLPRLGESSKLLDGRLVLGNRSMARHASADGRVSHQLAGLRIGVAVLARQPHR